MTTKAEIGGPEGPDLERMLEELRGICETLERGDTLEKSLELYEHGVRLARQIEATLSSAERRMVSLITPDGKLVRVDE